MIQKISDNITDYREFADVLEQINELASKYEINEDIIKEKEKFIARFLSDYLKLEGYHSVWNDGESYLISGF